MYRYLAILLVLAVPAVAVEPLGSDALLEQCSSSEELAAEACRSWIHGFIGGAFASRTARVSSKKESETYSERATRTRVGRGRNVYGYNYDARYCIPAETTIEQLVERLNEHAAVMKERPLQANQLMLGMLRKNYPCDD